MFDTVVVEGLKMPNLPKDIAKYLKDNNIDLSYDLQTKDLDNTLSVYTINDKGQLFLTVHRTTGKKKPYEPLGFPDNRSFLEKLYSKIKYRKLDRNLPKLVDVMVPVKVKSNLTNTFTAGLYKEVSGRYLDADYEFVANNGKITRVKLVNCELEPAKKAAERKANDAAFDAKMKASFEARRKLTSSWYYPVLKETYNPFVFFSRILIQAVCNKIVNWTYRWHGI